MNIKGARLIFACFSCLFLSCDTKTTKAVMIPDASKDIEVVTDFGTIVMRLSDQTPKHRDNFIKLVNERFYDSILFHRVIENFLIQTGDHKTKPFSFQKSNDSTRLPGLIQSEFRPNLLHKRGALNAAREGDYVNPSRSSHGSQFTIIQGKIQTDSSLNYNLNRVNEWSAKNNVMNRHEYKTDLQHFANLSQRMDEIEIAESTFSKEEATETRASFMELKNRIDSYNFDSLAQIELKTMKAYSYPDSHSEVYKTIGGAAHLDQNYTVFGEVVKGMNIVDSIASTLTNKTDKPLKDVYIITARMIKRKQYNF